MRLLGHIVVGVLALAMVGLGLWQLDRLDQRKEHNALVAARIDAPSLTAAEAVGQVPERIEHRRVVARGRYLADDEVLLRFRSRNGLPGYHVLTPLELSGGAGVVLVNRGWVPLQVGDRWPLRSAAPPPGDVQVVGRARTPEAGALNPSTRDDVVRVSRADPEAIGRRIDLDLPPTYLELLGVQDTDRFPIPVPAPRLSEGPHLSYALQWFAFAAIAVVGWTLRVRRRVRRPSAEWEEAEAVSATPEAT